MDAVLVNVDFERRVVVPAPTAASGVPSTEPGAHRHRLDRVDGEVARATSIVRYTHGGGEEILVLEGLFRDEHREYQAGTWLRSPRWSRHTPFTGVYGALIYVKVGHLGATLLEPVS